MSASRLRRSLLRSLLDVAALGDVALGMVLILGAPSRTSGPSFATARDLMPLPTWGALVLAVGTVLAAATLGYRRLPVPLVSRLRIAGGALGCGWHAFFAAAFESTAEMDVRAARTGVVAYGTLALLHLALAWHRGED